MYCIEGFRFPLELRMAGGL